MKMKFTLPWSVCRICLQKGKLYSMFIKDNYGVTLADKIMMIGDIKICHNKRLPEEICKKCAIILNSAYTFRMECKKSDYILQLFLEEDQKKPARKEPTVMTLKTGQTVAVPKGVTLKTTSAKVPSKETETRSHIQLNKSTPKTETGSHIQMNRSTPKTETGSNIQMNKSTSNFLTTNGVIIKIPKGIQIKYPKKLLDISTRNSAVTDMDTDKKTEDAESQITYDPLLIDLTIPNEETPETDPAQNEIMSQDSQDSQDLLRIDIDETEYSNDDDVEINEEFLDDDDDCYQVEEPKNDDEPKEDKIEETQEQEILSVNIARRLISQNKALMNLVGNKKIIYVQQDRKQYCCELCGKVYKSQTGFAVHMREHRNEKPFECEICSAKFVQSSKLVTHMRRHTGEKRFKCDSCDRRFFNKESKLMHQRIHTGERPYKCDVCGKKFAYQCVLSRHKILHTNKNEKKFYCAPCRKRFRFNYHLQAHLKTSSHQKS